MLLILGFPSPLVVIRETEFGVDRPESEAVPEFEPVVEEEWQESDDEDLDALPCP